MSLKRWKGPDGWTGYAVGGWTTFPVQLLPWLTLERRHRKEGNCTCVKAGNSRRVFRIDPASAGMTEDVIQVSESVFAKRYLVNNLRRRMGRLFSGSRAEREFRLGQAMVKAGLPTPEPLVCAENVRASRIDRFGQVLKLPAASYLVTRTWHNDGSIPSYIWRHRETSRDWAVVIARFLSYLHDRGFYHDDCSSEHFLIAPNPNLQKILNATKSGWHFDALHSPLAVIDIDNGLLGSQPVELARRLMNLFQVIRSSSRAFPPDVRWVFLAEYLHSAGLDRKISLTQAAEEINRIAMRKVGRRVLSFKSPEH